MSAEEFILSELQRFLDSKNVEGINLALTRPKAKEFGDFASNLAMQLAGKLRMKPRDIADEIISFLNQDKKYISRTEIAGPGFINFFISDGSVFEQLRNIISDGGTFGNNDSGKGVRTQVEFISANPTGPLTIGHGRQAVLGDTIARLLEACGYDVTREYYYNNAGRQMRILGESVRVRYLQELGEDIEFPEDHYRGDYIRDVAKKIVAEKGDSLKSDTQSGYFKDQAEQAVFADIRGTISRLGFEMDVFFNEQSLYDEGKIAEVIDGLRERGLVDERDGATWFLTTKLGQEQDRVIVKSSGEPTYRLPDIAYHREKIKRGFDLVIDIFGADHIATYPDVLMAIDALGYDKDKIKVLIHQFVTLMEGNEKVKMSTRKANFVTLDELIDEVGVDVTRFFFLMRHMNSHLNFDLSLAKNQSDENPVYYVQYAHARICSILNFAKEQGISAKADAPLELLTEDESQALIKFLADFPRIVRESAESFEPHRLTNYLTDAATLFHKFYTVCRVVTEDESQTQARLALCLATRIVLANGCKLLGISAPERM
jgi:arginyl-tRNA synthetase